MSNDPWADDDLEFGDTELDMDVAAENWDLVQDEAMLDGIFDGEADDSDNCDDDLIAPSADAIAALLSQMQSPPRSERDEVVLPSDHDANRSRLVEPTPVQSSPAKSTPAEATVAATPAQPTVAATTAVGAADDRPDHPVDRSATDLNRLAIENRAAIDRLDDELREAFLDDAQSCIGSMEQSLLKLEVEPNDRDALNQICRELHTLKGASASVGLTALAEQLHRLEDTLTDDHQAGRSPDISELLMTVDSVRMQINGPVPSDNRAGEGTDSPEQGGSQPIPQASFVDDVDDDESVRVKSSQLNRLMDMLAQLVMLRNRRGNELSELQEIYHELIGSVSKMRMISHETDPATAACSSLQLSEVANDVLEVAQQVRECSRPISEGNTAVSQFIREFREELVELRRTPIAGLFRRLQRVVRDAAKAEGKEVRLELLGADAGIERALQQRLYEPLLHIVRNSVCHGIESPADRQQRGKACCGVISLEAKSGPDLFIIEVRDDGRGLDYDAIRRRGVESGLLTSGQTVSREELSQLIFKPGFSTRQTADQIAGRGVGMDVVATTLQRMRGWLEVDSEADRGTIIRLSFPLPSVIQHAMVFRAANQLFALPMQSIQTTGGTHSAGTQVPLADLLGQTTSQAAEPDQRITLSCELPGAKGDRAANRRVTILVDEIVGPEELVVRPLPTLLKRHPYCSGATLSGMGSTVIFLDARRLVESHAIHAGSGSAPIISDSTSSPKPIHRSTPRVLVADDSISARKRVVRSLRRYGVQIVEAVDGKQALEIMKQDSFTAIFSDMEMPHVSGMELLAEVNTHDDAPPVVIISSRNEVEFTSRAKELGANNYLIKPLTDEALDDAIAGIPSLNQLRPIDLTDRPQEALPHPSESF